MKSTGLSIIRSAVAAALLAGTPGLGADAIVTVEAESGTLGSDVTIVSGTPTYITVPTGTLVSGNPGTASRVATYSVTFPSAGTYNLFARVRTGPDAFDDDSCFYANGFGAKSPTVDDDWILCNNTVDGGFSFPDEVVTGVGSAGGQVWKWMNLSDYTGDYGEAPVTFTVPAGSLTQTFQLGGRENGFDIDRFAFGTSGLPFTVADLDNGTVPTNTIPTNQVTIMAIGDSITDDCIINGAWRKPLQPLLDDGGYAFTFVGRQTSSYEAGFTKRNFEGYCGAVIAAPGYFGAHQYAAADNYLHKIVPEALAANPNPDVILILIGANDIGNGRDPVLVATGHMSTLLDMIFASAPDVEVVLAKATRLDGLFGDAIGENIPIYNAALQAEVNRRRGLGQSVHMADLYSAVTHPANFSDGLHPNSTGLQQAANEWFTRLRTIMDRSNVVGTLLVRGGADWKYRDTGEDLGDGWRQNDHDDSGWSSGAARLGYGDSVAATTVSYGSQANNKHVTTYFRRPFVVPANTVITNLDLRVAQSDGAVVYLNGQEVYRSNLPAGTISSASLATSTLSYYARYHFDSVDVPVNLTSGTNWIAAEVHLASPSATSMGFDVELIGSGYPIPSPSLSIARVDEDNVALSWPLANGTAFLLHSATNLAASTDWTPVMTSIQTNGGAFRVTEPAGAGRQLFRLSTP